MLAEEYFPKHSYSQFFLTDISSLSCACAYILSNSKVVFVISIIIPVVVKDPLCLIFSLLKCPFTMVYRSLPWFTVVYQASLLGPTVVYRDLPLFIKYNH